MNEITAVRLPLLIAALALAGPARASPRAPANPGKSARPPAHSLLHVQSQDRLRYALLAGLLAKANTSLRGHPGCSGTEWKTIGQFVAWSLSFYGDDQANSIRATCGKGEDGRPTCSIDFFADSKGESPWACGFRFTLDRTETQPDVASLECTGSC